MQLPELLNTRATTVAEFRLLVQNSGFTEYPYILMGDELEVASMVNYENADLDLRIYLTRLVLCRNFSAAGGYEVLTDHCWLLRSFLSDYDSDAIKPWLTPTVREAIECVVSEEVFTRNLLGTTFLFGVLEFYAKYLLGWRPNEVDFFDKKANRQFREMFLPDAIIRLKKSPYPLAVDLNAIDKHSTTRLKERGIPEVRWVKSKIADRLGLVRNAMLHGEEHSFYGVGRYLAVLYILFHWHTVKANTPAGESNS
jgi:hypothetical protein